MSHHKPKKNDKRILVVEDDELNGRMYRRLFTFHGFDIRWVITGREAITHAKSWQPHLIYLDLMLPEMNGFVALDILVAHPDTKHIPVVTFSNLSKQSEINKLIARGAVHHVIKAEIDPRALVTLTEQLLILKSPVNSSKLP